MNCEAQLYDIGVHDRVTLNRCSIICFGFWIGAVFDRRILPFFRWYFRTERLRLNNYKSTH